MLQNLFLAAIFFTALSALASPVTPKASKAQELQQIQNEVKKLEGGLKLSKQAEASLSSELTRLEKLLKIQSLEIKLSTIELEKLTESVQEMNLRKESLETSLNNRKRRLRYMLSLLPSLETRSPFAYLTQEDGAYLSQYREMVSRMLATDKKEIVALKNILDDVESLNAKLGGDQERLVAHTEDLKEKQSVLELNQQLKKDLLQRTRAEQTQKLKAYQSAKVAESELEGMMNRLNLAAEVKKEEMIAVHALPRRVSAGFLSRKGALPLPVAGRIVSAFGKKYDPKTSLYTFHKGVDIQTDPGAEVKAVFPGKVVFSGELGGYGKLLILDHGDQFYSLVGHLGEVRKEDGDTVMEGEVIARSSRDQTPVYFEIRQRHIALNPLPWFLEKSRATAGLKQ